MSQAWEDAGTDQRDTLGIRKHPAAMAKGSGRGRRTEKAESRGWGDATDREQLGSGVDHPQLTVHLLGFGLGSTLQLRHLGHVPHVSV